MKLRRVKRPRAARGVCNIPELNELPLESLLIGYRIERVPRSSSRRDDEGGNESRVPILADVITGKLPGTAVRAVRTRAARTRVPK